MKAFFVSQQFIYIGHILYHVVSKRNIGKGTEVSEDRVMVTKLS